MMLIKVEPSGFLTAHQTVLFLVLFIWEDTSITMKLVQRAIFLLPELYHEIETLKYPLKQKQAWVT